MQGNSATAQRDYDPHSAKFRKSNAMLGEQTDPYLWWNDTLASHFFNESMSGQPVNLFVTRELIQDIGRDRRLHLPDFIEAVNNGPKWAPHGRICEKASAILDNWRRRNLDYPPYVAYLALFVLAAGHEGDFAANAYYPRLRELLGQKPETGTYPGYQEMRRLWEDLEQWSVSDKQGNWGVFTVRIAGSRAHVGLPIAQVILSEHERQELPDIFADSYLDPGLPYSDSELAYALKRYSSGRLTSSTLAILNSQNAETSRFDTLLETVREEFAKWDGSSESAVTSNDNKSVRVNGGLRLRLIVDRTAARVRATLHCHLNRDFPEDGLVVSCKGLGSFSCEENLEGWSTPLVSLYNDQELDALKLGWAKEIELREKNLGWSFRLPARDIRLFASGAVLGLHGYVEVNNLSNLQEFLVACAPVHAEKIRTWGDKSCKQLAELNIQSGLPNGWRLFSGKEPTSDAGISEISPNLAFSSTVRIALRNGIRMGKGNTFFSFGIPDVGIEGGNGQEQVLCEGRELIASPDTRLYKLPGDLPLASRITIVVCRGGEILRRESLYLQSDTGWPQCNPVKLFDPFGKPVTNGSADSGSFAGAWCNHKPDSPAPYIYPMGSGRNIVTYFIGSEPGQIVRWPKEPMPVDWSPVWAVIMRRRGKVVFCGLDLVPPSSRTQKNVSRAKKKEWVDVLWYERRRVQAPSLPRLREMWQRYVKAAQDAK